MESVRIRLSRIAHAVFATAVLTATLAGAARAGGFTVTHLVTDGTIPAAHFDRHLVNAWGISYAPGGPFWISDNGTGLSTIYSSDGTAAPLVVTVPAPTAGDTSAPTGQVFNGTTGFMVHSGAVSGSAVFLFATEDGTISGWSPVVDPTHAILAVDRSGSGAVYKGLAMGHSVLGDVLYATDFHNRRVDAFNSNFQYLGSFTDPAVPQDYAPFGIQAFGDLIYITFAEQKPPDNHDDLAGPGHGYIDVFNANSELLARLVSNGPLNSPWGMAVAPASFGSFAGSLLVGNFGDGRINAFNPITGRYLGALQGSSGAPLVLPGLWGLIPGNGGKGGDVNMVYYTAGPNDESDGAFGQIFMPNFRWR